MLAAREHEIHRAGPRTRGTAGTVSRCLWTTTSRPMP